MMDKRRSHYQLLAETFRYPSEGYKDWVNKLMKRLKEDYPDVVKEFDPFYGYINKHSEIEIEELFSKTFHIQAICYLDLGFVLFGEDYKRGEFLVNMKSEQRKINYDCGEELADNLANVLMLISKYEDDGFLVELVNLIIIPSLNKMLEGFEESKIALKQKLYQKKSKVLIQKDIPHMNIYQSALKTLLLVVKTDFYDDSYRIEEAYDPADRFINNCGTCGVTHSLAKKKNEIIK